MHLKSSVHGVEEGPLMVRIIQLAQMEADVAEAEKMKGEIEGREPPGGSPLLLIPHLLSLPCHCSLARPPTPSSMFPAPPSILFVPCPSSLAVFLHNFHAGLHASVSVRRTSGANVAAGEDGGHPGAHGGNSAGRVDPKIAPAEDPGLIAARDGDLDALRGLVERGWDPVGTTDKHGSTALHFASGAGQLEVRFASRGTDSPRHGCS